MIVNIMTSALVPGDAIGNYVYSLRRILMDLGFQVRLYADSVLGLYRVLSTHSMHYRPTGEDILWFHYSIHFDGMSWIKESNDFKIMDFHGVSPPRLFTGYNSKLERLCQLGEAALPGLINEFDLCVVHSEYSRDVLRDLGCGKLIEKIPLVVDLRHFTGAEDLELSRLLSRIEYLLFVGRIVPQKDILYLLRVFHQLKNYRRGIKLFLVGSYDFSSRYYREIQGLIQKLDLEQDVILTGKIAEPSTLTSFYKHARFSIFMSEWETFCVPVVESAYFGTPVIASNVCSLPETVGDAGILIHKDEPAEVASVIAEWLGDQVRYQALQARTKLHALHYTEDVLREEVFSLLKRSGVL